MGKQYTANAYCNEEKIATKEGDDIDQLYAWMVLQANGNFGDVHGEIIDNTTNKIVRKFQKAYED
ncbi:MULTISPECIES: hypothetical protein [Legionella]|uniref:Uncharacterized protein n=1 Tax=Legionella maceachernii TaxID=466 RepID=A0A0W0W4A3_9GAMM|nr:hypothetical protein [Legionella maceachernii]KTD27162.1 hypothetical protein Lmac_1410 [Legionella maceachernii]SKA13779.1 hypothetical protein SAMN02745128_02246 [Legionella maceachernii]SUP04816.1 Uncharacterised protein [Legionella maceachernii]